MNDIVQALWSIVSDKVDKWKDLGGLRRKEKPRDPLALLLRTSQEELRALPVSPSLGVGMSLGVTHLGVASASSFTFITNFLH